MKVLASILTGLLVLAVLGCAGVVISAWLSGFHWVFDIIGQFQLPALWLLLACGLALLLLIPLRRNRLANKLLAGVALALCAIGWLLIWPWNSGPTSHQGATALTVYQHNIWGNHPDPGRTMRGAIASNADIVALVEAYEGELTAYRDELQRVWPYHSRDVLSRGSSSSGLQLYSRYPILSANVRAPDDSPAMLETRLQLPDGELTVLIIHFTRPWPFQDPAAQLRQLDGLVQKLETINGPLIMLGDVNSAAWGRLATPLRREQGFTLVNDARGGTWPARMPLKLDVPTRSWPPTLSIPIDLAFCRGEIRCFDHEIGDHFGSDHRSVTFSVITEQQATDAR